MITIHNLIIHNIVKKQFDKTVTTKERPTEIKVGKTQITFLEKLLSVYYNKSNPSYGVFDSNITSFPYQSLLKKFIDEKNSFQSFTINSLNHFVTKIKDETNATGGFFLVAYFTRQGSDFLSIIMLNNTTNYDIDENELDIIEKITLDVDKVDVANIINLKKWMANDNTYLSFTKGRKEISGYFINFIGCTQLTDSKHYSKNLKLAFNDFLNSENLTVDQKLTYKMNAYSHFSQKAKEKKDVDINVFANELFPVEPEKLKNFISNEKYQITANFRCDMSVFKDYQYIFYNSKDLNFRFHRSLIETNQISYNKEEKSLTINKIDQSVINQIEE